MRTEICTNFILPALVSRPVWGILVSVLFWTIPTRALSPDTPLDHSLPDFDAPSTLELYSLCSRSRIPCGFEDAHLARDGYKFGWATGHDLHLKDTTPRKVADELVHRYPGHHWFLREGVLVFEPNKRVYPDLLGRKLDHVSIHGSSWMAAHYVFARAMIRAWPPKTIGGGGRNFPPEPEKDPPFYGRIDLELNDTTVREALNAIVRADGQVLWEYFPPKTDKEFATFGLPSWRTSGVSLWAAQREFDEKLKSERIDFKVTRWW